ncbi:MAG: PHB depolymerase family esterase [Chloroflexaceae bacterium]
MKNAFLFLAAICLLSACVRPQSDHLRPGNHDLALEVDGRTRTFILHVPPAARQDRPLPMLIVLHGGGGTGQKMQRFLGFDSYADERGFYVAYPDSYQPPGERGTFHWNDGRGTERTADVDDVKFILEMVAEIGRRVALDANRVYVTGASNGGMLTYRLGCATAGVFAGIAPVIANIPEPIFATCHPSAPLNVLAINGSADPLIPLEGGEVCADIRFGCAGGRVVAQAESVGAFAAANRCDPVPQSVTLPVEVDDGTFVEQQTYVNCAGGARVMAYIVHNGGHTWPPRPGQLPAAGAQSRNLDATRLIVEFFFP